MNKTFAVMLAAVIFLGAHPGAGRAADERFARADRAFLERSEPAKAREALVLYRELYRRDPSDAQAAWRLSMACYFVGFNLARDRREKERIYAEGRDAGLAAVRGAPRSAEAHFWAAINMALYGETVGVLKMLFTLGAVREHLQTSRAIDPAYAYGGANRILGKIDESLPGVLGGSKERAREYYRQAIERAPDEPTNYLFLARLMADCFGRHAEALELARQGLAVPRPAAFRFESIDALRELRIFIEREEQRR